MREEEVSKGTPRKGKLANGKEGTVKGKAKSRVERRESLEVGGSKVGKR